MTRSGSFRQSNECFVCKCMSTRTAPLLRHGPWCTFSFTFTAVNRRERERKRERERQISVPECPFESSAPLWLPALQFQPHGGRALLQLLERAVVIDHDVGACAFVLGRHLRRHHGAR